MTVFRVCLSVTLGLFLAACEVLPSSGPLVVEVRRDSQGGIDAGGNGGVTEAAFTLVEVDRAIVTSVNGAAVDPFPQRMPTTGSGASFRIEVGDQVTVSLWETPVGSDGGRLFAAESMTAGASPVRIPPQAVGPDGRISVPFAGRIKVLGRTSAEVERSIIEGLGQKTFDPQAIVAVEKTTTRLVSVLGDAVAGGSIPLGANSDRVVDVLARAGGVRTPLSETIVALTRNNELVAAPLSRLLREPAENVRLSPGDLVTVSHQPRSFVAVGATGSNRRSTFGYEPLTLTEALGQVDGILDNRADPEGVYVMRFEDSGFATAVLGARESGVSAAGEGLAAVAYQFDMKAAETLFLAQDFELRDKDVVFVSNAPIVELQKLLGVFNSTAGSVLVIQRTNL